MEAINVLLIDSEVLRVSGSSSVSCLNYLNAPVAPLKEKQDHERQTSLSHVS